MFANSWNNSVTTTKYIEYINSIRHMSTALQNTSSTLIASGTCPRHVLLFLSHGVGKVLLWRHNRSRVCLSTLRSTPSLVNFVPFQRTKEEEGRPVMVRRKLDGALDEPSVDRNFRKPHATVHNLWKIWKPAPSGTGSYGRQAGRQFGRRNLGEA